MRNPGVSQYLNLLASSPAGQARLIAWLEQGEAPWGLDLLETKEGEPPGEPSTCEGGEPVAPVVQYIWLATLQQGLQ